MIQKEFFDSIGQNAKSSSRADVFRFALDNRHAVTATP
jgi:hypothetical protein